MPDRYYDPQCPICMQDVDTLQPDYYRILAMHPEHAKLLHEKPRFKLGTILILDTLQAKCGQTTDGAYTERVWLLTQDAWSLFESSLSRSYIFWST